MSGPDLLERFEGCIVGQAVGDALGAPVEFMSAAAVTVDGFAPYDGLPAGSFTDDTQLAIATAEGILDAHRAAGDVAEAVWKRYLTWLRRQDEPGYRRAPGATCVSAISRGGFARPATNNSKDAGGIMRIAPVGLAYAQDPGRAFDAGCELARLTHGHPTGYIAAGCFAEIVARAVAGAPLTRAIASARVRLQVERDGAETLSAVDRAVGMACSGASVSEVAVAVAASPVKGAGWVAEECLAVALAAALRFPDDYREGVLAAVNIDGDRDTTGAVAGALIGAMVGIGGVPAEWADAVEGREALYELSRYLYIAFA